MYGNYMGYQPQMQNYVNPYQTRLDQLNANMAKCEIVRVNGKNGAEAYQLPPMLVQLRQHLTKTEYP